MKLRPYDDGLTVGQRTAQRGHVPARPWDADWQVQQMRACGDYLMANPWVQQCVGKNVDITFSQSPKGELLIVLVPEKTTGTRRASNRRAP